MKYGKKIDYTPIKLFHLKTVYPSKIMKKLHFPLTWCGVGDEGRKEQGVSDFHSLGNNVISVILLWESFFSSLVRL